MSGKILRLILIPLVVITLLNSIFIVNEFEQAIVLQFGKPIDSKTDAGLYFKLPFLQNVVKFEKRILEWDGDATEIPTKGMKDQRVEGQEQQKKQETTNILIDTFARWEISDPLKFYKSVNNEVQAQSRLDGIIDGKIRDAIAPKYIDDIVQDGDRIMQEALTQVQLELESLDIGVKVIDIEIKRVQFNDKIMPQVFSRMASEQEAEAAKFEGQGKARQAEILGIIEREVSLIISTANRDVQIIKGEADAEAASLYAEAYKDDPTFYELWKTWDALSTVLGSKANFWLSTQNYPNSNIFGTRPNSLK
tara:strand:+ start:797 stop:1717 length:921 start_codon:yes stop_codon:yes gene_type:complete